MGRIIGRYHNPIGLLMLMPTYSYIKMTTKIREHQKAILQYNSNRFYLTIPRWLVKKILDAEKGSVIKFDFSGNKVILEKEIEQNG